MSAEREQMRRAAEHDALRPAPAAAEAAPNRLTSLVGGMGNQAFGALARRSGAGPLTEYRAPVARVPIAGPVAPARRDPVEVALARTAVARRIAPTPADSRTVARDAATQELRDAADAAQKIDTISKQAGGVTNVQDAAAAQAAMRNVDDGSASLDLITSLSDTNLLGDGGIPQLRAENAATRQQLEFYAGFLGEETRTGVDFTDRYRKAHAQFARLEAMAKQYEASHGVDATTSKGLLDAEAGAKSAKEAGERFEADRGKLKPEQAADLTAAMTKLEATQTAMNDAKADVAKASEDARTGFRDGSSATARVKQAAERHCSSTRPTSRSSSARRTSRRWTRATCGAAVRRTRTARTRRGDTGARRVPRVTSGC